VRQIRRGLGLSAEARYERLVGCEIGVKNLHGDGAVQQSVFCFEDVCHAAAREMFDYPIPIGKNTVFHVDEGTSE
jgi:hypothetical protein